jgi:hypothetical protein
VGRGEVEETLVLCGMHSTFIFRPKIEENMVEVCCAALLALLERHGGSVMAGDETNSFGVGGAEVRSTASLVASNRRRRGPKSAGQPFIRGKVCLMDGSKSA